MKFYAVGYTNGGANEKQLGPFDSIDEAKRNGITEMNRNRGAFSFSGVVDDDGKYVFKNSAPRSTNTVVQNALAAKGVARNARVPEVERRLKTILSVEIPKLNKLYDDARKLDKSIKNELDRLARDVGDISDSDANRLGKIVYDIRTASPFGSL